MNDVTSDGYVGREDPTTAQDDFNAQAFLIQQILNGNWTITLGQVKSVTGGGATASPPVVSVQPMVNQTDGQVNPTPHGNINNVPAFRLQGGSGAFIADPVVGDIGLLACAMSDISAVKQNKAPANPGSFRTFSPSDAMYFGALLGAAPSQYVQITPNGINIVFPGGASVALSSSGIVLNFGSLNISLGSGGAVFNCPVAFASTVSGEAGGGGTINFGNASTTTTGTQTMADATIGGRDFLSHAHTGVQPGGGDTGPPA